MAKRIFDILIASVLVILFLPILIISWIICAINTSSTGLFFQERVGFKGKSFKIFKFRTLNSNDKIPTYVGAFFRKYKLDELPQLFNVIKGDMSMVGPRPDIIGYYDELEGDDRKILSLKPGITSEAALKYFKEEELLKKTKNPAMYNDNYIFPDKVKMNLAYYNKQSLIIDLQILLKTIKYLIYKK